MLRFDKFVMCCGTIVKLHTSFHHPSSFVSPSVAAWDPILISFKVQAGAIFYGAAGHIAVYEMSTHLLMLSLTSDWLLQPIRRGGCLSGTLCCRSVQKFRLIYSQVHFCQSQESRSLWHLHSNFEYDLQYTINIYITTIESKWVLLIMDVHLNPAGSFSWMFRAQGCWPFGCHHSCHPILGGSVIFMGVFCIFKLFLIFCHFFFCSFVWNCCPFVAVCLANKNC